MTQNTHKILSVIIVTLGAFLGFEAVSFALGIYQLRSSFLLSLYIYAFHIFWLTFVFDLHLKSKGDWERGIMAALNQRFAYMKNWYHFRHFQNYLVLPGLIYWGSITLLLLNPFDTLLKQLIVIASTIALSVAYWFMKEHVSRKLEHQENWIKILSLVKLYAAFIIFSSVIGVTFYYGFNPSFTFFAVFTLTFLIIYQALFQHRLLNFGIFLWVVIISLVMSIISLWVYNNWNTEYLTAGLLMLAIYNCMWGILHHRLDHTLNKKIAFEYLAMMFLVVSIVLATHNFGVQVI